MKDIHTGKLLSASMKMAELPDIDSGLLGVMRRLGIRFGFGERTVSEVCAENKINPNTLLLICKIYISDNYVPSEEELSKNSIGDIVTYLHNSHDFYTGNALANLENDVKAMADIRSRLGLHETIKNLTGVPVLAILTSATDAGFTQDYEGQIYLSDKTDEVEQKISAAVSVNANETRGDSEELSAREKEILVCVAKGMLNKEIADHYNISIYTVITHRKHITRKTGIKTVAGLTVYALLNNLIDMNSME